MPVVLKRFASVFVIFFSAYCLLGFLILPGWGLRIANQQLSERFNVPASISRLEVNPLTLRLTAWDIRLGSLETPQVMLDRIEADLSWSTLWTGMLRLSSVELDNPQLSLKFDKEGRFNLIETLNLPEPEPLENNGAGVFPLHIDRIAFNQGQIRFQDERTSQPIDVALNTIDIELLDLDTQGENAGDLTLTAKTAHGGAIAWQGEVHLATRSSSGHLDIQNLPLSMGWAYVEDLFPLKLEKGEMNLAADYRVNFDDALGLTVEKGVIQLNDLAIQKEDGKALTQSSRLDIDPVFFNLSKQQIFIGRIQGQQLDAWMIRERDGRIDWQTIFAPVPANTEPTSSSASAPWHVRIDQIALKDYRFHLEDRQTEQPVSFLAGPLALEASGFDTASGEPMAVKLNTQFGKLGQLQAEGKLVLDPISAQLNILSSNIDLRLAQAYLSPFVRVELRSGFLNSHLAVDLRSIEPLDLTIDGDIGIHQLHMLDTLKQRDLVKWKALKLDGLTYRHGKNLDIRRIDVDQPYARFIINDDQSTNIDDLIIEQPATSPSKDTQPLSIVIGGIAVKDGSALFADRSLLPPFATAIQELSGKIGQLDTQSLHPADIHLQGKVDKYAPVSITGLLVPFDYLRKLDIIAQFKNMDLTTLTPYSGKFAGYRIRKGRLDLDLHYRIDGGQLEADNTVVLQQLQLGERVESPDAVDLPVKLAVALLKDTRGDIRIHLPVKGNLNDPQFSVMPIVWQTLRNLVLRTVQSPFKLITGMSGNEADFGNVSFSPGSPVLTQHEKNQLTALVKALDDRPSLVLEVEGVSSAVNDGPFVAENRLQQEYQNLYYRMLQQRGEKVPENAEELEVPENLHPVLLEGIYRQRLGQQPPDEWDDLNKTSRTEKLKQALLTQWTDNVGLLRRLAQKRAAGIKDFLAEQGLDNERIFLIDSHISKEDHKDSIVSRLHLSSQ